jgi:hypothetical protein
MNVPGIGKVTKDKQFGHLQSEPIALTVFGGKKCRIILERYDGDRRPDDFHRAIANLLSLTPSVFASVTDDLYNYYKDMEEYWLSDGAERIKKSELWKHVQFGGMAYVQRRDERDKDVYVSVECECDWEPEHGLQIVFKNGEKVSKLGPFDGHLTNGDAYANRKFDGVVYRSFRH